MFRQFSSLVLGMLLASAAICSPAVAQDQKSQELPPVPMSAAGPAVDAAHARKMELPDVLAFVYQNNPTILAARSALLATQEQLPQALAGWKPSASASADITRSDVDPSSGNDQGATTKTLGLDVSQPLYRGGRTISSVESAKNVIWAQRASLRVTEQDILLQAVTAYMNVLRDQSLYDLSVNNRGVISKQLDASRARFDAGDVTRTDVSQSEARLALTEATVVSSLGNLRGSMAVFEEITGLPPSGVVFPSTQVVLPKTLDEAAAMAEVYNPSVLVAEFLQYAAEDDIRTVFGELYPDIGLFGGLTHRRDPLSGTSDRETVTSFGISATIPLYEAGAVRSRARAARNTATQRKIKVSEARRLARQEAISNWESLRAAQFEITSRRAQVEASRVARDGVYKETELGTRTILDALNADQELLDAESALVTAQRNEVVANFTLAANLGLLNPQTIGFPELKQDYNEHADEIMHKVFSTSTKFGQNWPQGEKNQGGSVSR